MMRVIAVNRNLQLFVNLYGYLNPVLPVLVVAPFYLSGHISDFGQVTQTFLEYLAAPQTLPAWERPNLLAKYRLTTLGVERARTGT